MESMEVNVQSQKNKSQLNNAPVAIYSIVELPPNVGGVTIAETIQIVPKAEIEDDASNQSYDGNVTVTTPFVNTESEKQNLASRVIRHPIPILRKNNKSQNELPYAYVCDNENELFDPNLSCKVCGRSFKHNSHLKRHTNIHTGERTYKCDLCGKAFLDASTLSRHRKIHSGDKPWSCKICKKSFGTLGSLRRHITIHNQEGRPYQCETCKKRFPDFSSYQKHTFIHTGIKPHICDICSKAFVHIGGLNGHRKIHTEVKPYNCERCGKDFTKYSNYSRHLLIHEGDKEFSCTICGVSYNFQSSLTRHLLMHVRKGNKAAAENSSESYLSECFIQDEILSEVKNECTQEIKKPASEVTKKAVLTTNEMKVTGTKMKHFTGVRHVNEVESFTESEKYKPSLQPAEGSEQNPSEPQLKNEPTLSEVSESDCTILPPQDEFISKQKTTEDVTSLLTSAEDFGSIKEIPQTLLPARLELVPDMQSPEPLAALLTNNENGFLLCRKPENLNSDSFISSSKSLVTIISITNESDSMVGITNKSCSSVSDSDVVVVLGSSRLSTAESILPDISDDRDENEITKKLKSISYGVSSD